MRRDLQSILSFFILSTLLLVLPGCISQKKLDNFREKHVGSTVFEYVYKNKTYLAAVEVSFEALDRAPESDFSKVLSQETAAVDLDNYQKPAVVANISPPVFLKKSHQGKIKLLLNKENIQASKGLKLDMKSNMNVVDGANQLIFDAGKEEVSKQESLKFNLNLMDEDGGLLDSDILSFKRIINFTLPQLKVKFEEPCLEKTYVIQLLSDGLLPIREGFLENDTLGYFETDTLGKISLDICEDLLPNTFLLRLTARDHQPRMLSIYLGEDRSPINISLQLNPAGNLIDDKDTDGDGLPDGNDQCPNIPGPVSNGGCPMDFDKDGVYDAQDRCPNRPGPAYNDGCPIEPKNIGNKSTEEVTETLPELVEERLWETIKSSEVPSDFEDYLNQFPDGKHVQDAQKKLQDSYTKIARGLMSILIPDTMELNVPEIVTVMISGDTSLAARERVIDEFIDQQDLPPSDIPSVRDELIKITEIMRAELRDPSPPNDRNFFIDPPGEREQKVDLYGEDPTIWNWTVTPLKKGNHRLNVVVSIIFDQNGKEVPKVEEQLFTILIIVQPTFWEKNLWWIIGGVLLLGALLWFLLFRKKEKQKEQIQLQLPFQEIMGLIGEGELKDALEKLETALDGVSDKYYQQVILFKSRLAENEENINMGVVDTKDATLEQTRITKGVLTLMGKLKEEFEIRS